MPVGWPVKQAVCLCSVTTWAQRQEKPRSAPETAPRIALYSTLQGPLADLSSTHSNCTSLLGKLPTFIWKNPCRRGRVTTLPLKLEITGQLYSPQLQLHWQLPCFQSIPCQTKMSCYLRETITKVRTVKQGHRQRRSKESYKERFLRYKRDSM